LDTAELVISIAFGILGITGITAGAILTRIKRRMRKDVTVRRIEKNTDNDFDDFCDLFKQRIRYELRENPDDVGKWLDDYHESKKNHQLTLYEYLTVAKREGAVIGFMFFEYSVRTKFLYIDFLGAKDNDGEPCYRRVTPPLVKDCYKRMLKEMPECKLIIFELDDENDSSLTKKQRHDAEVKKDLFGLQLQRNKELRARGAKAYEICIDYHQPPLHRNQQQGIKQDLVIVPLDWPISTGGKTITRAQFGEILRFLFFESYDTLSESRYLGVEYHSILNEYYEKLLESAPDKIPLKPLVRE